jgi:alkylhydroperoxidase family enzyme
MQRVQSVQPEHAHGRASELLTTVKETFGVVPNAVMVMANSSAVLESYLAFTTAMGRATIGEKLYHQIKLATSEVNASPYCTSLLCAVGPRAGLTPNDLMEGRSAMATDTRTDAALKFAKIVLETKGQIGDDALRPVRRAGFGDAEIVEIVASVVVGCFTNFLNNVAETALDIPEAEPLVGRVS